MVLIRQIRYLYNQQYHDHSRGAFKIGTVTGRLLMASAVYLISSLFGILLNLSGNYLIAILCTGSLALFLAFKLDEFIAKVPWLNETIVTIVLIIISVLCIVKVFFILKPKQVADNTLLDDSIKVSIPVYETDLNKAMRDGIKSDSQSVFDLSNMLEEQWGRKPTYEEVMDYIDHLVIPEDEEYQQCI